MKRQDEKYYGGLREAVLDRDRRRCRTCPNLELHKLAVHQRVPGVSKLELMITLCTRCHAIIERTQIVLNEMMPLLLVLWREKGALAKI
jgi:5-methylcytosine-specific restriction endonuclease McrA